MSPATQDYLGSYRLLNLVRTGKTCQLWEAVRDTTGERFALKVLTSEHRHDKEQLALLKREYQAGSGLRHPFVIRVYELTAERENVYLVMEYFPAPNLKQLILQGVDKLAPVAASFIEHGAQALGYLHQQGWVHRDVKPDNFLLNPEGGLRLIDFALAQRIPRGLARWFVPRGKVQGTRSYMSPEQIRCRPLDERADLYSFGCVLFELLAGRPPFTGASTNDLLNKHLRNPPPPLQAHNPLVTDPFCLLLARTLAKSPDARPQTMEQFLREFRAAPLFKQPPRAARD